MEEYSLQHAYKSINNESIEQTVKKEPSSDIIIISQSPVTSCSLVMELQPPSLNRIQSLNKEKVQQSINKQKMKKQASLLERQICIQDICFEEHREKQSEEQHRTHKAIKFTDLVNRLQMVRCNYHFAKSKQQQVVNLLDQLDSIYHQIVRFQEEISKLFHKIKMDAQRHIADVKHSFSSDYYDLLRRRLHDNFDFANVKYALHQIEKFKHIQYPNLDYPCFKANNMKNRIAKSNVNNKVIGIESINSWIQRLYAFDKKDTKVITNRSIASFLKKTPCEQIMFSYYLKADEYVVTNGKRLTRVGMANGNVPIAVVEKQLLPMTEIKFRVTSMGGKGIFIGVSPLAMVERLRFENCIKEESSYYLTSRGDILPFQHTKRSNGLTRMPFKANDQITVKRQKNTIIWRRKKDQQQVHIPLSINEYSENFYVCIHLQDTESVIEIID